MQNNIDGFWLSPQQQTVWKQQQNDPTAYYAQCAIRLDGLLERAILQKALNTVIIQHEILHTAFYRLPGMSMPVQVIADTNKPVTWVERDLSHVAAAEQAAQIDAYLHTDRQQPFDFESSPLLRASYLFFTAQQSVLLVTMPALYADSHSLGNLVKALSETYAALQQGQEPLYEGVQYLQFSEWQNALLRGEEGEIGKAHWQEQPVFTAAPALLPFELTPPALGQFEPTIVPLASLPSAQLKQIAQQYKTTPEVVLLACWQALLGRIVGAETAVVNASFDGRKYEELQDGLGLFARYAPVAVPYDPEVTFAQFLASIQEARETARDWEDYFIKDAVANTSAFDFEYISQLPPFQVENLAFSLLQQNCLMQRFKVKLTCTETADGLFGCLEYDPAVVRDAYAEHLARQLVTLINGVMAAPQTKVGQLPLLDEASRHELLEMWNETINPELQEKTIHQFFEEQAARIPTKTAVIFDTQQLSYEELNTRANQLAHYLRRHGVTVDTPVALFLERSVEMLIAILGIFKAGGAYVPLDLDSPTTRLDYQIKDTQPPVLITKMELLDRLPSTAGKIICLDRDKQEVAQEASANPTHITCLHHLAYIIYTSGSTGTPKGVCVTHQGLTNYTQAICQKIAADDTFHFATVSTMSADLGNTAIYPSLVSGGCLHILGYEVITDSHRFADYFNKHHIDVLKITPSHLRALLTEEAKPLPHRYLILGGEMLSPDLLAQIADHLNGCQVLNHYGPTETTIGSLTFAYHPQQDTGYISSIPIGRPIANTHVYILDNYLNPVPVGMPGELYIAGKGVARGYLNQETQTAARFISNPFGRYPRFYRTGDLVRYWPDGNIEFLGRVDHQVKIRGFRIELGEIESQLAQHPNVQQAVVTAPWDEERGDRRLFAYVVSQSMPAPATTELREFLREFLPEYMVPTNFVTLEHLPLTRNGKVNWQALPDPSQVVAKADVPYVPPATEVEQTVAAVWQKVLQLERVGLNDNFFEIGGHSLLMVQVHSELIQTFQKEMTVMDLFQHPTVATLSQFLTETESDEEKLQPSLTRANARRAAIAARRR